MNMIAEEQERQSDSPHVELITRGITAIDGSTIRPAECQWHMVVVKHSGSMQLFVVGPLTTTGVVTFTKGAEILWIKFKLGSFMPQLPAAGVLDVEAALRGASSQSFWLNGSAWQFPDYENADTFIHRLVRSDVLARDPVVSAALADHPPEMSPRSVRDRFVRATGLTHSRIRQVERAKRAAARLRQGQSILDTVDAEGYFDQPHLTRSLKQWVGYTPAQLVRMSAPVCQFIQDGEPAPGYHMGVLENIR